MKSINMWIIALFAGVKVSPLDIILMKLRQVPPEVILEGMIVVKKAGLSITLTQLQVHYLAGGDIKAVIRMLLVAKEADLELDFDYAAAYDLNEIIIVKQPYCLTSSVQQLSLAPHKSTYF